MVRDNCMKLRAAVKEALSWNASDIRGFEDISPDMSMLKARRAVLRDALKPTRRREPIVVLVDVRGGAVQYTSIPRDVKLIIRDWDNCPDCGGEHCNGGAVQPCPEAKPFVEFCAVCKVGDGHRADCATWDSPERKAAEKAVKAARGDRKGYADGLGGS